MSKGVGYVIEGFVASLIIFVFAFGFFLQGGSYNTSWIEYRTQITVSDLESSLAASGEMQEIVRAGGNTALQRVYSDITDNELEAQTTFVSTPSTSTSVGVFVPESKRNVLPVQNVDAGDRCNGELEEINRESGTTVKRTTATGPLESSYGVRLYLVDADPRFPGDFNGETDYDTVYVDNGTSCQFSSSEGPILLDERFYWGDRATDLPGDFHEIEFYNGSMVVYNATLMAELSEASSRSDIVSSDVTYDGFNLTEPLDYDVLFFHTRETLSKLNSFEPKIDSFMREGSVILAAELLRTDLNDPFLEDSGLKWVNLSGSVSGVVSWKENAASSEMKSYFDSIGCYACEAISLDANAKIASPGNQYIDPKSQILNSQSSYDTSDWNVDTTFSRISPGANDEVPESSCSEDYWGGTVQLPEETGYDSYRVVVTHLGTSNSFCSRGRYAVNIDYDKDGTISGQDEDSEIINGSEQVINQRPYTVTIENPGSSVDFEMTYSGGDSIEHVNYVRGFEDQRIQEFARMPALYEGGEIGGGDGEEVVLGSALVLKMAKSSDYETSESLASTQTSTVLGNLPLTVRTRWSR